MSRPYPGLIRRYRDCLPVSRRTPVITLLEGNTPLIPAPRLARRAGLPEDSVFLKFEGANPTGSFKDRGMTLAISKALEDGSPGVLCASTGNTAASAAAYAARAGLRCLVLLPAGGVAAGKLAQSLMHGAEVVAVRGNFDQALELAKNAAESEGWTLVNSLNPYRIEGQKTAAFELIEALGRPPAFQFMPVGNAGNIRAYWKGYTEAAQRRPAPSSSSRPRGGDRKDPGGLGRPRMMGWQAAGAAPIVLGRPVPRPKTFASAIRIGNPASWAQAVAAAGESRGSIGKVSDAQILSAYRFLAEEEGVFCEPASASGVAGLLRFARDGGFRRRKTGGPVVCVLTGHGLKDPDAPSRIRRKLREIRPDPEAVRRLLRASP